MGRLQPVPHGHHRGKRRQGIRGHARRAGRIRRRITEQGRGGAEGRPLPRRDRRARDSIAQGTGKLRGRRISAPRNHARCDEKPQACVRQGRLGHGGKRFGPERRRRSRRAHVGKEGEGARAAPAREDQGICVGGRRSPLHGDGTGARIQALPCARRVGAEGSRSDGDQRGVRGAGDRRQPADGMGHEEGQCERRRDRARASDRRVRLPDPGHVAA